MRARAAAVLVAAAIAGSARGPGSTPDSAPVLSGLICKLSRGHGPTSAGAALRPPDPSLLRVFPALCQPNPAAWSFLAVSLPYLNLFDADEHFCAHGRYLLKTCANAQSGGPCRHFEIRFSNHLSSVIRLTQKPWRELLPCAP